MFEDFFKQDLWNHQHSPAAKAINKFYHPGWIKEDPVFTNPDGSHWRPPGYKPQRGRSPIQTRFKREPATVKRDQQAWNLRSLGYSYPEISEMMGYASRQAAHLAVKRAQRDNLARQSRVDKPPLAAMPAPLPRSREKIKLGRARGRAFPPVQP